MILLLCIIKGFFIVSGVAIALVILRSLNCALTFGKRYNREVADILIRKYNLRVPVAYEEVGNKYPLITTSLFNYELPHPDIAAAQIFWEGQPRLSGSEHYNDRQVPYHLFTPENWGRLSIDV
jgi:hypothetical protein